MKLRASDFLYWPTSRFSSSKSNIENQTDLLELLRKLRLQKEEAEAEAERLRLQKEQEEAEAERLRLQKEQEEAEVERVILKNIIKTFWIIFSIMVFTVLIGIILHRYYFDYFNNFSFVRLITRWFWLQGASEQSLWFLICNTN